MAEKKTQTILKLIWFRKLNFSEKDLEARLNHPSAPYREEEARQLQEGS